ncbi:ATPase involved in DNA repair [Nitrincola lacisaponensis]|uniref:ATPase involved in DNA repair n=1 Tax=Nitrincola lacisaponensis TaxID=267850 RepID=A0A063Y168_9GAMM|nr:PHP domain-containing protein [Nitrincola lacisaponensis]KDE40053.1 ATPase involved in DNA repair [Nitrincola lacisaponensis]
MILDNNFNNGARFFRADLHIHSYGKDSGSFDVNDQQMTPQNIVDTAIDSNLKIISITDHNEILNSKAAIDYAEGKDIFVVPGIEVSTTQGHLLVYFQSFQDLRSFYGKLTISDDKERCSQGIVECLNFASQFNGFGILAHIELDSGFEKTVVRFNAQMEDILCHPALLALEISKKDSFYLYTDDDSDSNRLALVKERRSRLNLHDDAILPKVMSSDSHSINKLGTNAEGNKKLTRFKVDELSFQAIRIALMSYESRVRIEDVIPERVPKFVKVQIKGGLLDGQFIDFSNNLSCIIGGRGTGKSTLMEIVRAASGNESSKEVVDSDVWPDDISLFYEDETGKVIEFRRSKNGDAFNYTDGDDGLQKVPMECYGQSETADTIKNSDDDPQKLLDFLDGFLEVEHLKQEDANVCQLLLDNQSALGKLRIEVAAIKDTERQLNSLKEKKSRLEQDKVGDLVKHQVALVKEKGLRDDLIEQLKNLVKNYREVLKDSTFFEYFDNFSDDEIIVGKDQIAEVKRLIDEFSEIVSGKSDELNLALEEKIELLKVQLESWKSKESDIQKQIDDKKSELEKAGIPFDIGKINQIAKDLEYYEKRLRKLQADQVKLKDAENERAQLLRQRIELKKNIYKERYAFSVQINNNLKNSVDGLFVSAKFSEGGYSPRFEELLKQVMGWRTSQVKRSEIIASNMSPITFSSEVKRRRKSAFANILDENGGPVFSNEDIDRIFEQVGESNTYEDFQALTYEDRPHILVTKVVEVDGQTRNISKSISKLSLGQQQSILLAILIQSKNNIPLLIDQPEDHLDSEFVYKTIVANLKKIKETRQVIIVTHNANIAVLGDAELIVPLRSTSDKTSIVNRGSIDRESIQKDCCAILEGGERAFLQRQNIYSL